MSTVVVYLGLTAVALLVGWAIRNRIKHKRFWELYAKFDGNRPLPLIGNVLEFGTTSEDTLKGLCRMWKDNNMTTYRFLIGTTAFLHLGEPEDVEALLSSNKEILKSKDYDFYKAWLGDGLLLSFGSKWRRRRKVITPTFHFKILEQFLSVFSEKGNIFVRKLGEHLGETIDIYNFVTLCALDVICETAMGTNVNAQQNSESEYVKAVYTIAEILHRRSFSAWKRYDILYRLSSDYKEEQRLLQILHKMTNDVIRSRREALENNQFFKLEESKSEDIGVKTRTAFLDLLLTSKSDNGESLSDESIREEVDTFMFEGHDTTSSCITFAIYALANAPEVQSLAFEEQFAIFGSDADKEITHNDLQSMQYLERVIKETLRMYPSVPLFGRDLIDDLALPDGRIVPSGTTVVVFPFTIGRNPKFFPQPEKFDPDRFLPEKVRSQNPYTFVPFSAGPRNCIGQKFAMLEIKSILSKLIRNYEIVSAGPEYELKLAAEAILKSKSGAHVILRKRKYM